MSSTTLKLMIKPTFALLGSMLFLAACSGDGRPLLEEVEVNDLQLKAISIVQPVGLLANLFVNPGTSHTFTLSAINQADLPVGVSSINRRWSVVNAADSNTGATVASIDESGNLLAISEGTALITARIGGIGSEAFSITVKKELLESIENIIGADSMERCVPEGYRAEGRFQPVDGSGGGSLRGLPNAEWEVVNAEIGLVSAPVDGFATATGVNVGSLQLVAISDGIKSQPQSITILNTLRDITIEPENLAVQNGSTLNLIATGGYINGDIESRAVITDSVQWLAEDEDNGILQVSNLSSSKGQVSTIAVGNAVVTVACGDVQNQKTVVVIPASSTTNTGISFEDESTLQVSLAAGTRQLNVSTGSEYAEANDITTDDETEWSVFDGVGIVRVNNTTTSKGLLTPLSAGTATIRATYNNQLQDLTVQVVLP